MDTEYSLIASVEMDATVRLKLLQAVSALKGTMYTVTQEINLHGTYRIVNSYSYANEIRAYKKYRSLVSAYSK